MYRRAFKLIEYQNLNVQTIVRLKLTFKIKFK